MSREVLILFSVIQFAVGLSQETEFLSSPHLSSDTKNHTLLVFRFEYLDSADVYFDKRNRLVDPKKTQKYIDFENGHIRGHNKHLDHIFEHYNYEYKLINEDDLSDYPVDEYPFVLQHDVVKLVKRNSHKSKNGFYSYTFHFYNRKTGRNYRDINFYSHSVWKVLKMIVDDMNFFLGGDSEKDNESLDE